MLNAVSIRHQPLPVHRLNQFPRKVSPIRGGRGVCDSGLLPNEPRPSKRGRVTRVRDNNSLIAKLFHKKCPRQWDTGCFSPGAHAVLLPGQQRLGVPFFAPLSHLGPHKAPKGHSTKHGAPDLWVSLHFPGFLALRRGLWDSLSLSAHGGRKLERFIADVKARCRWESPVVLLFLKLS